MLPTPPSRPLLELTLLRTTVDEPNNFLDLPSTLWLESYLTDTMETTLVITSHDQEFLNRVVDETIFIRAQTLRYFEGCGCRPAGRRRTGLLVDVPFSPSLGHQHSGR